MIIRLTFYLFLFFGGISSLFVSMGNYSEQLRDDLNLPECGGGKVPKTYKVSYNKKCFSSGYPNKTLILWKWRGGMKTKVFSRIFRGRNALIGESPWTVRLVVKDALCSGVLITFEWVLIAAHCLNDLVTKRYQFTEVQAGSIHTNKFKEIIQVNLQKVIQHPFYVNPHNKGQRSINKTRTQHDIALVKLNEKFTKQLNDGIYYHINTVCLPKADEMNGDEDIATMTGYGIIGYTDNVPDILQIGQISLLHPNFCPIRDMLCARLDKGDSGGPLVQFDHNSRAIVAGIYGGSFHDCTFDTGDLNYWVPVSKHIPWILESIGAN